MTAKTIENLERGKTLPYPSTAVALADALGLQLGARCRFLQAAATPLAARAPNGEPTDPWWLDVGIGNVVPLRSSFIGRCSEIHAAEADIRNLRNRLTSLVGPPGIGKTRLAERLAIRQLNDLEFDAVWWLDITRVDDASRIEAFIASTVISDQAVSADPLRSVVTALGQSRTLLIFDNCDHRLETQSDDPVRLVESLRDAVLRITNQCPGVTILATSRMRLEVDGERTHRLGPLSGAVTCSYIAGTASSESLQLLVERVTAAESAFALDEQGIDDAIAICRRVDGVPFSLELAAARIPSLGLATLRRLLDSSFDILPRYPGAPERQRGAYDMVRYSYNDLDALTSRLFRRLGVFRGTFTLRSAEDICSDSDLKPIEVAKGLILLADRSLVQFDAVRKSYRFLQVTAEFARVLLDADPNREALYRRYAEFFARFADRMYLRRWSRETVEEWLGAVSPVVNDVRAALRWCLRDGHDAELGVAITAGLSALWSYAGYREEGIDWVERAFALTAADTGSIELGRLHSAAASLGPGHARLANATEALATFEAQRDEREIAKCWVVLGNVRRDLGDADGAEVSYMRALELLPEAALERTRLHATTLNSLGIVYNERGCFDESAELRFRAVSIFEDLHEEYLKLDPLMNLAHIEFLRGDAALALRKATDVLASARRLRYLVAEANVLVNIAEYKLVLKSEDCLVAACDAVRASRAAQQTHLLLDALLTRARGFLYAGQVRRGGVLLGYVDEQFRKVKIVMYRGQRLAREDACENLRSAVGDKSAAAYLLHGGRMTDEQALEEALLY